MLWEYNREEVPHNSNDFSPVLLRRSEEYVEKERAVVHPNNLLHIQGDHLNSCWRRKEIVVSSLFCSSVCASLTGYG